jgi:TatD DNase family protein
MDGIVDVGVEPSDFERRVEAFAGIPTVALTAGLHPTSIRPDSVDAELGLLEQLLGRHAHDASQPRIVAVGEIGLDFYWSQEHARLQEEAFERQCELASRRRLPIIVHNRSSEPEMLAALERLRPAGVMHCFAQGADYARRCLDLGMYVSFGGNLTYKKSEDVREAARIVPDDRLLVETDSPYLSPQTVRGTANHPGHLGFTIDFLAELRATTPERIATVTARNTRRLFNLQRHGPEPC